MNGQRCEVKLDISKPANNASHCVCGENDKEIVMDDAQVIRKVI